MNIFLKHTDTIIKKEREGKIMNTKVAVRNYSNFEFYCMYRNRELYI